MQYITIDNVIKGILDLGKGSYLAKTDIEHSLLSALSRYPPPITNSLEFTGIILDSVRMEAYLPNDKVERIRTSLIGFKSRKSCTLRELHSLIGTLNFVCRVVVPGRPFLQRMIELTRNVSHPHHHIKLNSGFF